MARGAYCAIMHVLTNAQIATVIKPRPNNYNNNNDIVKDFVN